MTRFRQLAVAQSCAVCGRAGRGSYRIDPDGQVVCARHPLCQYCAQTHATSCPELSAGLITTVAQARAAGQQVSQDLARVGVTLPNAPMELTALTPPMEGLCVKVGDQHGNHRSCLVKIASGLGPTRFGWVWAHEHTHALLWLSGAPDMPSALEEGICQLVAMVWLTSRNVPPPSGLLHAAWNDPDPVYGEQMRLCVRTARRRGVPAVMSEIMAHGRLPRE